MTLNCIYWQTEEPWALYPCGFHGDPTFLSYILTEIIVLNTFAKFELKISVQNEWQQHLDLTRSKEVMNKHKTAAQYL